MIKVGTAKNKTLVALSDTEFSVLARRDASGTPDDTNISLVPIQEKLSLVGAKEIELKELKTLCNNILAKLNSIGL